MRPSARSALAAAAAIAIVVGALGGFAIGRSTAPKKASLATSARSAADGAGHRRSGVDGAGRVGGETERTAAGPLEAPSQLTRLFDRTTSDGVDIHAYATDGSNVWLPCGANGVCPNGSSAAAGCAPRHTTPRAPAPRSASPLPAEPTPTTAPRRSARLHDHGLRVELANDHAVGTLNVAAYPLSGAAAVVANDFTIGQPENAPANAWIVNTSPAVTTVRATWSDGYTDSMAPQNGWAVVAHNGGEH